METIKIFYRSIFYLGFFIGPRVHPIIKDSKNNYYELDQNSWKIKIFSGKLDNLTELTRIFFKKNRTPKEIIEVDKTKFLNAVKEFKKLHEGKIYNLFNLSTNCIGFKNFIINKSKKEKV